MEIEGADILSDITEVCCDPYVYCKDPAGFISNANPYVAGTDYSEHCPDWQASGTRDSAYYSCGNPNGNEPPAEPDPSCGWVDSSDTYEISDFSIDANLVPEHVLSQIISSGSYTGTDNCGTSSAIDISCYSSIVNTVAPGYCTHSGCKVESGGLFCESFQWVDAYRCECN